MCSIGQPEPDLVELILEMALPADKAPNEHGEVMFTSQQRDIQEVLQEMEAAFGDTDEDREEARSLMRDILRCVIWYVERSRVVDSRTVEGLDKPVEELEIEEVM